MNRKKISAVILLMVLVPAGLISNEWHDRSDRSWNRGQSLKKENRLSEAAEEFKKSAEAEKRSGTVRDERFSAALNEAAGIHYSLGEYEIALRFYDLLIKSTENGPAADRWNGLSGRGRTLHRAGKFKEAAIPLEEAYSLSSKEGMHDRSAVTAGILGALHRDAGDYDRAAEYYEKSSAHSEKTGIAANRAVALTGAGILNLARGRQAEAAAAFRQALEIDKKDNNEKGMAADYHNLSSVSIAAGSYTEAMEWLNLAVASDRKSGNKLGLANRLNSMGVIHTLQGDYEPAEREFRESLAINETAGNRKNTASINMNLGRLREAQNRKDEAVSFFLEALRISRELIKDARAAEKYSDIGERYESRSVFEDAYSFYSLALRREYSLKNMSGIVDAHTKIGRVLMSMKRFTEAAENFNEANRIIESNEPVDPVVLAENLQNLGSVSLALKKPADSVRHYDRALKTLASAPGGTAAYSIAVTSINNRLLAALSSLGRYEEALVLSETDLPLRLRGPEGASLFRYKNRSEKFVYPLKVNEKALVFLRSDRDTILRFTVSGGSIAFVPLDKAPVVRTLRDRYGSLMDRHIDSLIIDPNRYIPAPDSEEDHNIEFQKIITFYTHLLSKKFFTMKDKEIMEGMSSELGKYLLAGIPAQTSAESALIIKADGSLSAFPFETLIMPGGGYLAAAYNVRYIYSFSADRAVSARPYSDGRLSAVLFGDTEPMKVKPVPYTSESSAMMDNYSSKALSEKNTPAINSFYSAFKISDTASLPFSRLEVETLAITNTGASAHFRDGVGRSSISFLSDKGELAKYRSIHFAVNTAVIPEYPELGGLCLSASNDGSADFMLLPQIASLKLKSDAVFLTGASWYRSGYRRGEALWHISHAFISAGSRSCTAPLWQVDDRSRIWFFITVYRNMFEKNMKPADAVSNAKKLFITGDIKPPEVLEEKGGMSLSDAERLRYANPYYWGAYVHTGY